MLEQLRRILSYKLSIVELIGLGLILAIPYLIIGVIWSMTHSDHLDQLHGVDLAVSFLGSIASWPVLLFSDVCMT